MTRPGGTTGRIRVAFLIVDLKIGGTERTVERLSTTLDRRRFEPLVVSLTTPDPLGPVLARLGIPVLSLEARGPFDVRALRLLLRMLRRFRPDVLHAFLFHANLLARLIAPWVGNPAVIVSHRTLEGSRFRFSLERLLWGLSNRILCVSEAVREQLHRECGIPSRSLRVLRNGVSLPERTPTPRGLVALSCRLSPGKGVEEALRALDGLAPLQVIGDGSERARLQREFPSVSFPGAVDDPSTRLDGVSVFVHPSQLGEGLPNSILEAMAFGLPVVATDVGGTREAVQDGGTGFLVPPGNPHHLRARVRELLENPERARRMGERGRDVVRHLFSLDRMVREYEDLYLSLGRTRNPRLGSLNATRGSL